MALRFRRLRGLTLEVSRVRRQGVPAAWCNVSMGATRPVRPAVARRLDRRVRPECAEFGLYCHEYHDATKDPGQPASGAKLT
jgi:hypothetical protein